MDDLSSYTETESTQDEAISLVIRSRNKHSRFTEAHHDEDEEMVVELQQHGSAAFAGAAERNLEELVHYFATRYPGGFTAFEEHFLHEFVLPLEASAISLSASEQNTQENSVPQTMFHLLAPLTLLEVEALFAGDDSLREEYFGGEDIDTALLEAWINATKQWQTTQALDLNPQDRFDVCARAAFIKERQHILLR